MPHANKVGVFVYGDIGRSPRMNNHAQQLSNQNQVYLMGYLQSSPRVSILANQHIHLVDLSIHGLGAIRRRSFYLYALVRIIVQILQILYLFAWKHRGLKFVLIQNPPSIPNLFAIWLASFFGRYQIYIDFHNYGYTILRMKVKNKIINWIAKKYERVFGKRCNKAFCVSDAMKDDLQKRWGINAITLYDRPRQNFCPTEINKNLFFRKYGLTVPTQDQLMIVSSTSWTKDQDFSILLNAIEMYEAGVNRKKLRAFITGKGPQKQYYMNQISQKKDKWRNVSIQAVWLEADDYPVLLSLCHIGVCLHYSSSGLDLPMKVIDMFGAGIPVLAINYKCLPQLVKHGKNGYIFNHSSQLYEQIRKLGSSNDQLLALKAGAEEEKKHTWSRQWQQKFNK